MIAFIVGNRDRRTGDTSTSLARARPVSAASTVDRMVGLPAGTRVWKNRTGNGAKFATVMPHAPEYSHGSFPVRFDDGIWEVLDVSYVTAVSTEDSGTLPARTARTRRRAS